MNNDSGHILIVERGVDSFKQIELTDKTITLGRGRGADIIVDNSYVSSIHAEISVFEGQFAIKDLDSTNGTSVNGKELSKEKVKLNLEDKIQLADGEVVLRLVKQSSQPPVSTQDGLIQTDEPGKKPFPTGTVTFMFTDIYESSSMVDRLGDNKARIVLKDHERITRQEIEKHNGYEVKAQGDGFMVAFSSAREAVQCSISVQRAMSRYRIVNPGQPINVRIGLNTGEAITDENDFFGKSVIIAARVSSKADKDEIYVSSLTRQITESAGDINFEDKDEVALKGLSGVHKLSAVIWE